MLTSSVGKSLGNLMSGRNALLDAEVDTREEEEEEEE